MHIWQMQGWGQLQLSATPHPRPLPKNNISAAHCTPLVYLTQGIELLLQYEYQHKSNIYRSVLQPF